MDEYEALQAQLQVRLAGRSAHWHKYSQGWLNIPGSPVGGVCVPSGHGLHEKPAAGCKWRLAMHFFSWTYL